MCAATRDGRERSGRRGVWVDGCARARARGGGVEINSLHPEDRYDTPRKYSAGLEIDIAVNLLASSSPPPPPRLVETIALFALKSQDDEVLAATRANGDGKR